MVNYLPGDARYTGDEAKSRSGWQTNRKIPKKEECAHPAGEFRKVASSSKIGRPWAEKGADRSESKNPCAATAVVERGARRARLRREGGRESPADVEFRRALRVSLSLSLSLSLIFRALEGPQGYNRASETLSSVRAGFRSSPHARAFLTYHAYICILCGSARRKNFFCKSIAGPRFVRLS